MTRKEIYLDSIRKVLTEYQNTLPSDLQPKVRSELYLCKIYANLVGNDSIALPTDLIPRTREEILLEGIELATRDISGGGDVNVEELMIALTTIESSNENYIVTENAISIDKVHNKTTSTVTNGSNYTIAEIDTTGHTVLEVIE